MRFLIRASFVFCMSDSMTLLINDWACGLFANFDVRMRNTGCLK